MALAMGESNYERVFTGSQINVQYIQSLLNEDKIHSVVRDDFESSLRAGFGVSYTDQVQLFVEKDNLMKSRHIVANAFKDREDVAEDPDLYKQATKKAPEPTLSRPPERASSVRAGKRNNRSTFNLLLNFGLILYSGWRLSPLLRGESLSTLRIVVSSFILIFCTGAVILHFRK